MSLVLFITTGFWYCEHLGAPGVTVSSGFVVLDSLSIGFNSRKEFDLTLIQLHQTFRAPPKNAERPQKSALKVFRVGPSRPPPAHSSITQARLE